MKNLNIQNLTKESTSSSYTGWQLTGSQDSQHMSIFWEAKLAD